MTKTISIATMAAALLPFCGFAVTVEVAEGETAAVARAARDLQGDLDRATPGHTNDNRRIVVRTVANGEWESSRRTYRDGVWTVTGATPRGTIYGIYAISEELGVSPFWWFDDIPVRPREFALSEEERIIPEPAVKWRGIFINDEDIGIRKWAEKNYEKSCGASLGAKTYARVFEMMLRARLNCIWPAMHPGGYEFVARPENMERAKEYGVVVGTSHCEPMLRNNIYLSKDDKKKWNYLLFPDFIDSYWRWSVENYGANECIWTIGMRGIHDGGMPGRSKKEKIATMERIFARQQEMLKDAAHPNMLFVPYKEVLELFNSGLKVPEGATIMWPNDNFGYIRRLGGEQTAKHPGGVYWHVSYCGRPHNYMHVCTTPPGFMWWELGAKCAENNTKDIWMVNVGDVKPADLLIFALGRIAWNPQAYGPDAQSKILKEWAAQFGLDDAAKDKIAAHLAEYFRLGFIRKPEHMSKFWVDALTDEEKASFLAAYKALLAKDDEMENLLGDTWFDAIGFQIRFLAHSGIIFLEGLDKAAAKETLGALRKRYEALHGGKWKHFWHDVENEEAPRGNTWYTQMQWSWNEHGKRDRHGFPDRKHFKNVTLIDSDRAARWIDAAAFRSSKAANGGAWTRIDGLGRTGKALALYPVKPGVGEGAEATFEIEGPGELVIEALPDFALWPGLSLRFGVKINGGETIVAEVPHSDANIDENDGVRHAAVQDGFIRIAIPAGLQSGKNTVTLVAIDPGVVIDRIGVK